jgi:hypothetical protein
MAFEMENARAFEMVSVTGCVTACVKACVTACETACEMDSWKEQQGKSKEISTEHERVSSRV